MTEFPVALLFARVTDAFAVHFCGPGDKTLKIAQFGRRFGLGQELVPDILLDRYSVRRRERMAGSEMCARRLNAPVGGRKAGAPENRSPANREALALI